MLLDETSIFLQTLTSLHKLGKTFNDAYNKGKFCKIC